VSYDLIYVSLFTDRRLETTTLMKTSNNRLSLKIVWISFTILDVHLHRTSRIEILRHLAQRGHHVHFIAVRSKAVHYSKNSDMQITTIPLRYIPAISWMLFGFITLFYLPLYLIKMRPDFIITDPSTPIFSFLWKPILSRVLGFKMILDIRSTPTSLSTVKMLLFNISVFTAKAMFDGVTIVTNGMKKEVSKKFNMNPKNIGVWSEGTSIELFAYEKNIPYGLELRKKFGLSRKFVFFYHGALSRSRGIIECVKAIQLKKKEYPDIVIFLLGNGPAFHVLQRLIQESGVQDKVILHGPVNYEEVPKYIAMSDVGIVPLPNIPKWRNQCPLKLLEYLAMKRTAIVTDIPANREILGDKECAIYIPSCNPIQIARAMEFAYKNKKKLKEWGELGRTIIHQKYNWNEAAKDLENYLLEVKNRSFKW